MICLEYAEDRVGRYGTLSEQTDRLNTYEKKILGRKLKKLRGLFQYVLQSKKLPASGDSKQ